MGAPIKLISGFPPPANYSESPQGIGPLSMNHNTSSWLPEGAVYGTHQLVTFKNYDEGLAYAKNKETNSIGFYWICLCELS